MIYRRVKFGKTKNVTWVDTGKGDVMSMTSERWSERGSVILAFTDTKPALLENQGMWMLKTGMSLSLCSCLSLRARKA